MEPSMRKTVTLVNEIAAGCIPLVKTAETYEPNAC